ncbi:MAG: NifB/NifX family molybdenum-iron cluster-binding protein [Thiogranum sp.]
MSTSVKVAFATTNLKQVNQHFGAAESFAVYAVDAERSELVEVMQFGKLSMDGNEDKLAAKIAALDGCIAVYTQAVGASAVGQLKTRGIQPVKVTPDADVSDLLESLQEQLREGPSAWLARAIEAQKPADPDRFLKMEADGWEE